MISSKLLRFPYQALNRLPLVPFSGPYLLAVSSEKRFVWFQVPKVGTRTIHNYFRSVPVTLDEDRPGFVYFSPHRYRHYFKFAFVRNPWDRLVSCWTDKVTKLNYFKFPEADLQKLQRFDAFVEFVGGLDVTTCDRHLRLQSRLIDLGQIDHLGRMETFEEDFRCVCRRLNIQQHPIETRNASGKRPYETYYNDDLHKKVARIYAQDIQIFGYRFAPGP